MQQNCGELLRLKRSPSESVTVLRSYPLPRHRTCAGSHRAPAAAASSYCPIVFEFEVLLALVLLVQDVWVDARLP